MKSDPILKDEGLFCIVFLNHIPLPYGTTLRDAAADLGIVINDKLHIYLPADETQKLFDRMKEMDKEKEEQYERDKIINRLSSEDLPLSHF